MPTKAEISDQLNELLFLEDTIDFARMRKEDLETLLKAVADPSSLIRKGWKNLRDKARREVLEELMGHPFLDEVLKGLSAGRGGPLGLGILPSIRGQVRGFLSKEAEENE